MRVPNDPTPSVPAAPTLRPPLLQGAISRHRQGIDLIVACVLLLATLPHFVGDHGRRLGPGGALLVLAFGASLPIAIRRRAPLIALVVATVSLSIATAVGQSFAPDPFIALPVYQVASVRDRRTSIPALVFSSLALLVAAAIGAAQEPNSGEATFSVLLAVAAWFVGDSARVRRAYTAGLADQAAREALVRAQRGVAEERLRIARELHDVVAHSLSVIAVQSGVGRHVIDTQPEAAKAALGAVETTSRAALAELRHLLGVLRRADDGAPDLAPAPGLGDLGPLVEQIRLAGVAVELDVAVSPTRQLSAAMELSVYRIVQEALTNVVKHAGGAAVRVEVHDSDDELIVEVRDDGGGALPRYPAAPEDQYTHHGLTGMHERVALYNGTLSAGPRPEGGFCVDARLPLEEVSR